MPPVNILYLADGVLLEIMSTLDLTSIYLLSQTNSRFLRLSKDRTFAHHKLALRSQPAVVRHQTWGDAAADQIFRLVRRDLFCATCKANRDWPHFECAMKYMAELLLCKACLRHHPCYQFSSSQRELDGRECIGQEGSFWLCQHTSVKWEDMLEYARRAGDARGGLERIGCEKCETRRVNGCPGVVGSTIEADVRGPLAAGVPGDALEPSRPAKGLTRRNRPPIIRFTNRISIPFSWPADRDLNSTVLRDILHNAPERRQADAAFCPHVRLGDCKTVTGLIGALNAQGNADPAGESQVSITPAAEHAPWMPDGQMRPPADFTQYCALCHATYLTYRLESKLEILCLRSYRMDNAKRAWWEETSGKAWWLRQLDPESYGQEEDHDGRHVTWCPDAECYGRARWGPKSRGVTKRVGVISLPYDGGFAVDESGPV